MMPFPSLPQCIKCGVLVTALESCPTCILNGGNPQFLCSLCFELEHGEHAHNGAPA